MIKLKKIKKIKVLFVFKRESGVSLKLFCSYLDKMASSSQNIYGHLQNFSCCLKKYRVLKKFVTSSISLSLAAKARDSTVVAVRR